MKNKNIYYYTTKLLIYPTQSFTRKSYPKLDNQKTTIINKVILCIRGAKRFFISNQVKYFSLDSNCGPQDGSMPVLVLLIQTTSGVGM